MPLLGLTSTQAKLAKWLIRAAEIAIPVGYDYLTSDLVSNPTAPTTLEWRRFTVNWLRNTPSGTAEDKAQFKLDLVNITSDELDVTWTSGDYASVLAAIQTFCSSMATSYMASSQVFSELRGYRMKFRPSGVITDSHGIERIRPFQDAGPPVYVAALTGTGGTSASMPYQVAPTVTVRTAWPKHWGRSYMPTPTGGSIDSTGRLTSTYRTGVGGAYKTMLSTLHDAGFYPVVPVGQLHKEPFHGLLSPTQIVVDDIPDVQRRRRPKQAAARTVA